MLNDLAPAIRYARGRLKAEQVSNPSREEAVAGRGLVLYPTMFGPGAVIPFDIGHHPSSATRPAARAACGACEPARAPATSGG